MADTGKSPNTVYVVMDMEARFDVRFSARVFAERRLGEEFLQERVVVANNPLVRIVKGMLVVGDMEGGIAGERVEAREVLAKRGAPRGEFVYMVTDKRTSDRKRTFEGLHTSRAGAEAQIQSECETDWQQGVLSIHNRAVVPQRVLTEVPRQATVWLGRVSENDEEGMAQDVMVWTDEEKARHFGKAADKWALFGGTRNRYPGDMRRVDGIWSRTPKWNGREAMVFGAEAYAPDRETALELAREHWAERKRRGLSATEPLPTQSDERSAAALKKLADEQYRGHVARRWSNPVADRAREIAENAAAKSRQSKGRGRGAGL